MDALTITQMRKVLGMSYPTAFKIANREGEQRGGVWYVPAQYVITRVNDVRARAEKMEGVLIELGVLVKA